jgi:hypothetical protein
VDEGEERHKTALVWQSQVSQREQLPACREKSLGKADRFSHTKTGAR